MTWHVDGTFASNPVAENTDGDYTLSSANAIGVRGGALQLVRNSRVYGAPDANDIFYAPCDDGGTGGTLADISTGAANMTITTSAGADNWRMLGGTTAFIPSFGRRAIKSLFNFGAGNTWTIDLMVYPFSEKAATPNQTLCSYDHATNRFAIRWLAQSAFLRVDVNGASGSLNFQSGAAVFTPGLWHHVRLVIQPSDVKLFVNGVQQGSSTTNHGFAGGVTGNLELGYGSWVATYAHACALASFRIANVAKTGTEVLKLYSAAEQTATPTTTVSVASMVDFSTISQVWWDQRIASGGSGSCQPYYSVDGGAATAAGTAQTGSDRYYATGLSLTPASTFNVSIGLRSSGATLNNPGPLITGFGFIFSKVTLSAPVLGAPTASTTSSVTLPITAAASITDTVLHAIAPDNSQVSVTLTTATIPAGATTSYTMTGLTADVLYRFIAHHRDADGRAGPDSNVVTARAAATFASETAELFALATPVFASSASLGTGSGLGFRWGAIANASSYQVIVYNEGTTARVASGTATGLTKTFTGLTEGFYEATVQARAIDPEVKSEPSDPALVWLDDNGDTRTMTILKAVQARIQNNVAAFGDRVYLRPIGGINAQLFKRAQGAAICVVTAAGESADDGDHVEYLTTVRIIVGTSHNVVGDEMEDVLLGVGDRTADAELGVWALADQVAALFHQHTLGQVVAGSFEVGKGADLQMDDTKLVARSIDIRILNLLATL